MGLTTYVYHAKAAVGGSKKVTLLNLKHQHKKSFLSHYFFFRFGIFYSLITNANFFMLFQQLNNVQASFPIRGEKLKYGLNEKKKPA